VTAVTRWPLHPAPVEGEALSSWLHRIAACYGMELADLLEHDLEHPRLDDVDTAPPMALLDALVQRSGLGRDQLHGMTLAGLTPWLLDTLAPHPDPAAFATYVGQLSVLLPRHGRPSRAAPGWHAWLPTQPMHRACPRCLQESDHHALLLVWSLPLLLSCPRHGCWLQGYLGRPGTFLRWERADVPPRSADAAIVRMDRRTWQALTEGTVELPRRRVHAGLWFRLLRTLLEELNTAPSQQRAQVREVRSIWRRCGYPVRAGLKTWRPYETLDGSAQRRLLEAAAVTIGMIEAGELIAHGAEAALFLPEPVRADVDDSRSADGATAWQRAMAATAAAVAEAQRSPAVARDLFHLILLGRTDADAIGEAHRLLAAVGIPAGFLSH
jgi:hypothetical protein